MNESLIVFESEKGRRGPTSMKKYHCCATCKNFEAVKKDLGMKYFCTRLGYETKTHFQFNCWDPRDEIKKRLKKDQFKN